MCVDQTCKNRSGHCSKWMTGKLQAPDISWNKPFKERYTELWNEFINADKTYAVGDNLRAPTRETCVRWLTEAWASVTNETIIMSLLALPQSLMNLRTG